MSISSLDNRKQMQVPEKVHKTVSTTEAFDLLMN